MSTSRSILFSFLQLPQEASSGAPRSIRSIAELLAASGWKVRALATSATEGLPPVAAETWLRDAGHNIERSGHILRYQINGVQYDLVDSGPSPVTTLRFQHGDAFDLCFDEILKSDRPDIVVTYGGWGAEFSRRSRAREAGSVVVFSPRNASYTNGRAFQQVDAAFCSSTYIASQCRANANWEVPVLPLPVLSSEVVPAVAQPTFATFVNPEPGKGVTVFARIAEEVSRTRPDIPFLVLASRQGGQLLVDVGLRGGFDLRRHSNIMIADLVPQPSAFFAVTRLLLMPSIHEAAGRVAVEALLNGLPAIVSDREGLPGVVGDGAFVLPLPQEISARNPEPPSATAVQNWVDLTIRLMNDDVFYQQSAQRARNNRAMYQTEALRLAYDQFFSEVQR